MIAVVVAVLACAALALGLGWAVRRVRGTRALLVCATLVLPAGLLTDLLRMRGAPPLVVLAAAEVLTLGLILAAGRLYRSWVELLCETWLTAGCLTLLGVFAVAASRDMPTSLRTEVDIVAVSLAVFATTTLDRAVAARLTVTRVRRAARTAIWGRAAGWALLAAGAGVPGLAGIGMATVAGSELLGAATVVRGLGRPTPLGPHPVRLRAHSAPWALAAVTVAAEAFAYAFVKDFSRWSVLALTVGTGVALLCLQVLTTRRLERATEASQRRELYFRTLVQEATDVIAISDRRGRLEYVSPAVEHVLPGAQPMRLVGGEAAALVGVDREIFAAALAETSLHGRALVEGRRGDQVLEASIAAREDSYVLSVRDVTERDTMRASLHDLAYSDTLTGLANRSRLLTDLDALIRREGANGVHVLFVDLDGFKHVNDASGHHVGDAVLVQVAARLRETVPGSCLLARLGGDEFVVAMPGTVADAEDLAGRVHSHLLAPFAVDGRVYQLGCSIGIAGRTPDVDAAGLLQRADLAMDEAKGAHRPWRLYEPQMSAHVLEQAARDHDLAREWGPDSARLFLQPIVTTTGLRVHSAEALLRWRRAGGELTAPAAALAFADRTGRLDVLTGWMVDSALEQIAANPDLTTPIAVNMPPAVLTRQGYARALADRVAHAGIPPSRLQLELTEDALVEQGNEALNALEALHEEGFRLHIDDFGTGFSSLSYLVRLPVDGLKIDRSFTRAMMTSTAARSIVKGVSALAEEVGMDLVAEGVETPEEHRLLVELGVPLAQGFWYARPEAAEAVADRSRLDSWASARAPGTASNPQPASGMIGA